MATVFFKVCCAAMLITGLDAAPARADDLPAQFTCVFKQGGSFSYDKGGFRPEAIEARMQFDVSEIDLEAQTARLSTAKAQIPLRVMQALGAHHFLEVAVEGYLNITTVYARDAGTGTHPAVHSRHFGLLGQPLVAQYRGFCHPRK